MKALDFFLAGVGGQGTLLASSILARVGVGAGYDVKKSEVHGMAQRGGAVSSHIRWADHVWSPLISVSQADVLVAFEQLEALRHLEMLRPGGTVLVNDYSIVPVTVTTGSDTYPTRQEILHTVAQVTSDIRYIPGVQIAEELGNARANNVVLLGALARLLPVERAIWEKEIEQGVPTRHKDLNLKAFARGYEL